MQFESLHKNTNSQLRSCDERSDIQNPMLLHNVCKLWHALISLYCFVTLLRLYFNGKEDIVLLTVHLVI